MPSNPTYTIGYGGQKHAGFLMSRVPRKVGVLRTALPPTRIP
jgi:hypothetical protein